MCNVLRVGGEKWCWLRQSSEREEKIAEKPVTDAVCERRCLPVEVPPSIL